MRIQATRQAKRRIHTNVTFEDFTVVTNGGNGANGPLLIKPDHGTEVTLGANDTIDIRVISGRCGELIDITLVDTQLFRGDQRLKNPTGYVGPLIVALAYCRPERLLGNNLRENDVRVRVIDCLLYTSPSPRDKF